MKGTNASDVVMNLLSMPPASVSLDAGPPLSYSGGSVVYEARRKRTEWPEGVRMDDEVKALDERNGEWILCRTCAEHYEKTGRGRKPNDPEGFKVKMNGRFQEAAWLMHKNRVVAHKSAGGIDTGNDSSGSQGGSPSAHHHDSHGDPFELRDSDVVVVGIPSGSSDGNSGHHYNPHQHPAKRLKTTANANGGGSSGSERDGESDDSHPSHVGPLDLVVNEASGPFFMEEMRFDDAPESHPHPHVRNGSATIQLPRTGWRCPGVVPDFFYQANAELVHAFAKYYVGSYRVNVVRDLRSDKVMLYSHDCENRIVHRERPNQPISCDKCYAIWLHNKSFKRILKKMDRYNLVEDILRKSWSITEEDLSVLSKFKHSSGANLNIEGRKLKQAAITVLKRFNARKSPQEKQPSPSVAHLHHQQQQQLQQQRQQQLVGALGLPSLESALPNDDDHHHSPVAEAVEAAVSPAAANDPQQENAEV